ncbi:MAG: dipeptide epimerase, partial [Bacteroidia bacterium]
MKLSFAPYSLEFKHPFGIAHGTRTHTQVVYVRLESEGFCGYGEAALPPYLPETQNSVVDFLRKSDKVLSEIKLPFSMEEIVNSIDKIAEENTAAKAAIDIALHDLLGKFLNKPVHELLDLHKPQPKNTSVTISIGDLDLIPQKTKELDDFSLLKVKLGSGNDKEIISAIRKNTDKPIVVDVNQGWKDKHFALEMIEWLHTQNVLYIEQPLDKNNFADMKWLTERSPVPTIADESMQRLKDLSKIADCFSGINLKLMKCTGLYEGQKIIIAAKEKGLKINIGCMSESSCGIAAAAQLMSEADWIDLDGPMLIKNNPFSGVNFTHGKLVLPDSKGTGAQLTGELN